MQKHGGGAFGFSASSGRGEVLSGKGIPVALPVDSVSDMVCASHPSGSRAGTSASIAIGLVGVALFVGRMTEQTRLIVKLKAVNGMKDLVVSVKRIGL